jgi:hypothetical protein
MFHSKVTEALPMRDTLAHARWISISHQMVEGANREWAARRPHRGDTLMEVGGLNHWLYKWAIETGRLPDDGGRPGLYSEQVSRIYRDDPEAVVAEARAYYRLLVAEHL